MAEPEPPVVPVTVAMITRGRPGSALRTLHRLAALPERPPVIVVDNGTDSATAHALLSHPSSPRVLRPGRNTGAVGRTLAARHARTPYVAFSDDDSWWEPGSLARATALLDAYPALGLLAARTLVGASGRTEDPLNTILAASPLPPDPRLPGLPVLGFLGCAAVVRRSAFLTAGGFHPLLFFGAEETLLALDLTADGHGVAYVHEVVARHAPDRAPRPGRAALVRRNALLTDWLRRPLPLAARRTLDCAADALRGRPGAAAALAGTLDRLPRALLRHRAPLPPGVERAVREVERGTSRPSPASGARTEVPR
ncbi:Glycosyltransferase, GT2 family [Streptomyces sp. TverLS-915]|uniref:glycosyltransferase family 2 protein n=1 Tax=Streptomyces sp. TverLS-915 TaxID=1839763 RepID=UPI00081D94AA|nr:glycosyltransferase [Streptomyces sp. TverLS-915]SCD87191.1 Glycosyltransferase, GT2 family [Streptomyces sp. TverLS-915]